MERAVEKLDSLEVYDVTATLRTGYAGMVFVHAPSLGKQLAVDLWTINRICFYTLWQCGGSACGTDSRFWKYG